MILNVNSKLKLGPCWSFESTGMSQRDFIYSTLLFSWYRIFHKYCIVIGEIAENYPKGLTHDGLTIIYIYIYIYL